MTTSQDNNPKQQNQQNQINQWFRQTNPTGKCMQPAKMNSIDNQPLIYQNRFYGNYCGGCKFNFP